jgi:hypothetical protein
MKKAFIYIFIALFAFTSACTDDVLDKIDTNPNNPTAVPDNMLLTSIITTSVFSVSGTDLAWYSSVFVEHTTGVHGQLEQGDKRTGVNATIGNNTWNTLYAGVLADIEVLIKQATEAGNSHYAGIAKVMKAYNLGIATDLWGRIPYSEAIKGSENTTPKYDNQQDIYTALQTILDEAIADLAKSSVASPAGDDMLYGGDVTKWTKTAWALKARYYNRLSKVDPNGSATNALTAIGNAYSDASENCIFTSFTTASTGEHPWFQESNDRSHHAVSQTFGNLLTGLNDPRLNTFVGEIPAGGRVYAPNGSAQNDQSGNLYSRASSAIVNATAPLQLVTFDEMKFIEAEANLRLGNQAAANTAYQAAVTAAMTRQGVATADITTYLAQASVSPANVTLNEIITQKYISFWLFQPIEAYNDYRRTGIPTLTNTAGPAPRRFPYPTGELSNNAANVPNVTSGAGVWWDDQTED